MLIISFSYEVHICRFNSGKKTLLSVSSLLNADGDRKTFKILSVLCLFQVLGNGFQKTWLNTLDIFVQETNTG